jgi:hypothetical protein
MRLFSRAAADSGPVMQNFKTEPTDMDHFPGDKTGEPRAAASEAVLRSS